MLSASRHKTPLRRWAIARVALALVLTLVLLAGVAPLRSFSASSHECAMACCAGKPSHMAGSCSTAFSTEEETETPPAMEDEHSAHGHGTHSSAAAASQTKAIVKEDESAQSSAAHHSTSRVKSQMAARFASNVMTTPCSPECAAVASASSVQGRRPRHPASLTLGLRQRPPTGSLFKGYFTARTCKSAEARRLVRPRAPPSLLHNLSA